MRHSPGNHRIFVPKAEPRAQAYLFFFKSSSLLNESKNFETRRPVFRSLKLRWSSRSNGVSSESNGVSFESISVSKEFSEAQFSCSQKDLRRSATIWRNSATIFSAAGSSSPLESPGAGFAANGLKPFS
jgi:hypothetical protein